MTILQTLQKTVSANADVATTRTGDELRRRFQESVRSALPRSGGMAGWELENYLSAVIAPVIGDLVRELRSADAKLNDHLGHLRRRMELLDIRTRGQPEPRKVLRKVQQLEIALAVLRAGKKITRPKDLQRGSMHRAGAAAARLERQAWRRFHLLLDLSGNNG